MITKIQVHYVHGVELGVLCNKYNIYVNKGNILLKQTLYGFRNKLQIELV